MKKIWHILIIDDNPEDLADLRQMLLRGSDRRYRFTEAKLGSEALRIIREQHVGTFDCVLLDYHLPDMNAEEMLAELCMGGVLPPCPIVIITGAIKENVHNLIPAGAQDFINKSWTTPESLARVVENAVERYALLVERTQTKKALRLERERLALALQSGEMGIYDLNMTDGTLWWSPEVYYLFGVNPDIFALTLDTFSSLVHIDDRALLWQHQSKSLEQVQSFRNEFRVMHPDGGLRWIAQRGQIVFDDQGRHLRNFGVTIDITNQKLTEDVLYLNEELHNISFNLTPIGMVYVGLDGRFIKVNDKMCQITGYSAEELMSMHILNLTHLDDSIQDIKLLNAFLSGSTPSYENKKRYINKDGRIRWVIVKARMVTNANGQPVHTIGIIEDITDRERVECELIEAKRIAEHANQAKSDFLSNMSHELRTPLNAILGFAQLLENSVPPPSTAQVVRLHEIVKAGWYLLELINEILDLALIESGKLSLSPEPVSLIDVIIECQTMIEPKLKQRDIKLTIIPFDNSSFVYADRIRIKQALLNLLSNAIKYNRKHGTIEVRFTQSTPKHLRINIKDSGFGLTPEKMAQLFQPFNRLGQENSSEEGTGIGLVVTKQLIELMGGTIGVESRAGVGSEFWIELLRDIMPQLDTDISASLKRVPQIQKNTEQHTLLYVEDNPANLMLVEQIIESYPHLSMLSARDANIGLALARAHLPEMILMDINLPGISGFQALKILQRDPATAHIPVIALSANAMPHDIEKGLEAGFFRYLTKPIKINEFMIAVNEALKSSIK